MFVLVTEVIKIISFCINYKRYIMLELTFLKELTFVRQANQKSDICCIGIDKGFQPGVCIGCHDVLMSMNLSEIAILNIKVVLIAKLAKVGP